MTSNLDPYLEQQYNNRAAVPDHLDYLGSWKQRSEIFRAKVKGHLNIAYGVSARQLLDIFSLVDKQKSPVHVFIHGGYWQALDKDSFSFMAEAFNRKGECAVIVNYDLCPDVKLIDIIQQLKQAMLWIHRNIASYGGDPEHVQLTGHSAGAHLLATLLTTDWTKSSLVNYPFQQLNALSGLYDLQPLIATSVNQALALDKQSARQCSPIFDHLWKPSEGLKLNLLVGEQESLEYKKQSSQLADCWKDKLFIRYIEAPQTHHFSIPDYFLDHYAHYKE